MHAPDCPNLRAYIERHSGKVVRRLSWVLQTPTTFEVPFAYQGDTLSMMLAHEFFHWIAATDRERAADNLLLDEESQREEYSFPWWGSSKRVRIRELSTLHLELQLYELLPKEIADRHLNEFSTAAREWMRMVKDPHCVTPYTEKRLQRRLREAGVDLREMAAALVADYGSVVQN